MNKNSFKNRGREEVANSTFAEILVGQFLSFGKTH